MKIGDIDNINDRCRLVLYELKPDKNRYENWIAKKLSYKYSNNLVFEKQILINLEERLLVKNITIVEAVLNEHGIWVNKETGEHITYVEPVYKITEYGIRALKTGLFTSENIEKFWTKTFVRWVTLIGAVTGLISFIYNAINLKF